MRRWPRKSKSKINELPHLINVWLGHMSIAGPRPQTSRCFGVYSESVQPELIKVRPGLSGIGPILFRGEEKMMKVAADPVPRFQHQMERGGPVTVTHPEIERFFMTIPEACQLIMQAVSDDPELGEQPRGMRPTA